MELKELRQIQKGLPPSNYRKTIDKKINELFCKLTQLEKEEPSELSPLLMRGMKKAEPNLSKPQPKDVRQFKCDLCDTVCLGKKRLNKHIKKRH